MSPEEILFAALASPRGVVVQSPEANRLRLRLSAAKGKQPQVFANIRICTSRDNPEEEVWVVHAQKE